MVSVALFAVPESSSAVHAGADSRKDRRACVEIAEVNCVAVAGGSQGMPVKQTQAEGPTAGSAAQPSTMPAVPPDDLEARLDEALQETFPASDPIAVSAPHG